MPDDVSITRRELLESAGAIGTISIAGCGEGADSTDHTRTEPGQYRNPVYEPLFPDPTVIRDDDGVFWAYGSHMDKDDDKDELLVPILRSTDLVEWTYEGEAFESMPDWKDNSSLWAPNITIQNGEYCLYYSYSVWGSDQNPGIGLATAENPDGPFEDQGPVFREEDLGMTNCIDPFYHVVDDTPYMVWGSWFGIHGVEMTEDGRDYVEGTTFPLAGEHREGPLLIERDGYYYLFYATGLCCEGLDSTYQVEVGRSESFTGPYLNQNGTDLRTLNDHNSGVAILEGNDRFVGPGHGTAIQDDDGTWWFLYHAYDTEDGGFVDGTWRRTLMIDPITWDENGWPIIGDGTPSESGPRPVVDR
ncbi:family 43 glycosylhydrolase [Halorhabdus amylolytica]|uniref:family 43 glycosylhydrolase n=1 Tax=Halorhabdus amylolytica TaxID=2559573 RepID=UPI0010A9E8B9|nr:family 43 glycosylhydrolase [Halorhabdus amylolytica]